MRKTTNKIPLFIFFYVLRITLVSGDRQTFCRGFDDPLELVNDYNIKLTENDPEGPMYDTLQRATDQLVYTIRRLLADVTRLIAMLLSMDSLSSFRGHQLSQFLADTINVKQTSSYAPHWYTILNDSIPMYDPVAITNDTAMEMASIINGTQFDCNGKIFFASVLYCVAGSNCNEISLAAAEMFTYLVMSVAGGLFDNLNVNNDLAGILINNINDCAQTIFSDTNTTAYDGIPAASDDGQNTVNDPIEAVKYAISYVDNRLYSIIISDFDTILQLVYLNNSHQIHNVLASIIGTNISFNYCSLETLLNLSNEDSDPAIVNSTTAYKLAEQLTSIPEIKKCPFAINTKLTSDMLRCVGGFVPRDVNLISLFILQTLIILSTGGNTYVQVSSTIRHCSDVALQNNGTTS